MHVRQEKLQYAVKMKDSKNGIAVHATTNDHNEYREVAEVVKFKIQRIFKVLESLHINRYQQPGQWVYT